MADDITVDNGELTDFDVRALEIGGKKVQMFLPDALATRIDEGATYTYIGHALPGTATSAAYWRIQRLTNANDTIVFADGDGNFNNIWDDRAALTYT